LGGTKKRSVKEKPPSVNSTHLSDGTRQKRKIEKPVGGGRRRIEEREEIAYCARRKGGGSSLASLFWENLRRAGKIGKKEGRSLISVQRRMLSGLSSGVWNKGKREKRGTFVAEEKEISKAPKRI